MSKKTKSDKSCVVALGVVRSFERMGIQTGSEKGSEGGIEEPQLTQVYNYLLSSELFSVYRDAFEGLTGHTLSLIHKNVKETPSAESGRCNNEYCSILLDSNVCSKRCVDHTINLARNAQKKSFTESCEGNITTSLIPVKVKNAVVAYLRAGQIKLESKVCAEGLIDELASKLPESVVDDLRESFANLPELDRETYVNQLVVLGAFSMQLSQISAKILEGQSSNSIITDKCKLYIAKHLGDKICLDEMAQYVGVTNSYMCKQFKKFTGLTLVEYINLHRIDLAKKKLASGVEMKIIDLAYACGFQSLSQFNRTFQKFVSQSPSQYREENR